MINMLYHPSKSEALKIQAFIAAVLTLAIPVKAGKPDSLFVSDEVIRIELRSDFTGIQKSRSEDQEHFPAELVYYNPGGSPVRLHVRISARGNFRLKPDNCAFPPLMVDFGKESVRNTLFENQNRLKLVTPCQGEEDVVDEYVVYRVYNLVTDMSFRVRLAKVLYYDTGTGAVLFERYSFFIEDKDRMAERNNASVTEKFLTPFDIDYESYKKLSVFQFIIGNKDWYVTSRKNIVIIQPGNNTMKPVAVPYDFDFSGLVNAFYSIPRNLPAYTMGYRRGYKGICYTEDELEEVFDFFRELKPRFRLVIKNEKSLTGAARIEITDYINFSYSLLRSRAVVRKQFMEMCETKELYNIID